MKKCLLANLAVLSVQAMRHQICYYAYQIVNYDNESTVEHKTIAQTIYDSLTCSLEKDVCVYTAVSARNL